MAEDRKKRDLPQGSQSDMAVQMCPPLQNLGNKVLLPDQEAVLSHKYRHGL
jgi:hypothetical protein